MTQLTQQRLKRKPVVQHSSTSEASGVGVRFTPESRGCCTDGTAWWPSPQWPAWATEFTHADMILPGTGYDEYNGECRLVLVCTVHCTRTRHRGEPADDYKLADKSDRSRDCRRRSSAGCQAIIVFVVRSTRIA
jgi:hypothetical protein